MNLNRMFHMVYVIVAIATGISNCSLGKERYHERLLIEGNNGSGPGELKWAVLEDGLPYGPTSFAINRKGEIYVLDELNCRIVKFDSAGTYIATFPHDSASYYVDLTFDKVDNLYLRDDYHDIYIYDACMKFRRKIDLKGQGGSWGPVEITERGTIMVDDPDLTNRAYWSDYVLEIDTNGHVKSGKYDRYYIIVTKGEYYGEYYIEEWHSARMTRWSDSIYNKDDKPVFSAKDFKYPEIIGIDSSKNIYMLVAKEGTPDRDRLLRVSPNGSILADFSMRISPGHSDVCRTMRVSDAGYVYVLYGEILRGAVGDKWQLWEYYPVR